jgi:hypothetical protein
MRNIESSPWITQPELVEIKLVQQPGSSAQRSTEPQKISEFTLNFQVKRAAPPLDLKPTGAPAAKAPEAKGGKA